MPCTVHLSFLVLFVALPGTLKYRFDAHYRKPYFEVSGLQPGMGYNVFLIAHNSKGRSNATILQVYTLKDPEKQTGESGLGPKSTAGTFGGGRGANWVCNFMHVLICPGCSGRTGNHCLQINCRWSCTMAGSYSYS